MKSASFPQTKVPSVDSHPRTGPVGRPKASFQSRRASRRACSSLRQGMHRSNSAATRRLPTSAARQDPRAHPRASGLHPPSWTNGKVRRSLPAVATTRGAVSDDFPRATTPTPLSPVGCPASLEAAWQTHHPAKAPLRHLFREKETPSQKTWCLPPARPPWKPTTAVENPTSWVRGSRKVPFRPLRKCPSWRTKHPEWLEQS